MDDFEMTENTIETEANDETTEETSSGSGLVGALIGAGVVAVGAAVVGAVKRNPKVHDFIEAKKAARHQKAEDRWFKKGIKNGFISAPEAEVEAK